MAEDDDRGTESKEGTWMASAWAPISSLDHQPALPRPSANCRVRHGGGLATETNFDFPLSHHYSQALPVRPSWKSAIYPMHAHSFALNVGLDKHRLPDIPNRQKPKDELPTENMENIDPMLRTHPTQRLPDEYGHRPPPSPYTLNPIRLPPPQHRDQGPFGLPSLTQDSGNLPYYPLQSHGPRHPPSLPLPLSESLYRNESNAPQLAPLPPLQSGGRREDLKRPRACEACRGLKVRCDPDPVKGTCRRCAKAGRQCIVTVPSRKRQKKTDSRVAELEKKIDALTASLQATKNQAAASGSDEDSSDGEHAEETSGQKQEASTWLKPHDPASSSSHVPKSGRKRTRPSSEDRDQASPTRQSMIKSRRVSDHNIHGIPTNGQRLSLAPLDIALPGHEYADVVDRKILDAATAGTLFDHYTNNMTPHVPVVVFPPGTASGTVRRTKPVLFLAILSVAAGYFDADLQRKLMQEATRMYADCIMSKGEKSLELVQALQVSAIWYIPEDNKEANAYQFVHIAAVMAMHLGLGSPGPAAKKAGSEKAKPPPPGLAVKFSPHSIESRRAWLGCFLFCGNSGMGFRQKNLLQWDSYMDECIEILDSSPDALESDKILCYRVKLKRITDGVTDFLTTLDHSAASGSVDTQMEVGLKRFEQELQDWRAGQPPNVHSLNMELTFHALGAWIHVIGLRMDGNVAEAARGTDKKKTYGDNLNLANIDVIRKALNCFHKFIDTFLSFTLMELRTIPNFHFVSLTFAVLTLICFHNSSTAEDSELSKGMPPTDVKVESYMNRTIDMLQKLADNGGLRPAKNVLLVLKMTKMKFDQGKDGQPSLSNDAVLGPTPKFEPQPVDTEHSTPRLGYRKLSMHVDNEPVRMSTPEPSIPRSPQHKSQYQRLAPLAQTDNTSLRVLSEVAMGGSGSTHHNNSHINGEGWQHPQNGNYGVHLAPHQGGNPSQQSYSQGHQQSHYPTNPQYPELVLNAGNQWPQGLNLDQVMDSSFGDQPISTMLMQSEDLVNIMQASHGMGAFEGWQGAEEQ